MEEQSQNFMQTTTTSDTTVLSVDERIENVQDTENDTDVVVVSSHDVEEDATPVSPQDVEEDATSLSPQDVEDKDVSEKATTAEQEEEDDGVVCVVDKTEHLKLFCYKSCTDGDSEEVKSLRSVVKDLDGNVVATSLPFTDEYVVDEAFKMPSDVDLEEYVAYPSIEGTLVRVFHHTDGWHISTNRRLDAFKSYWSCHFSFGQLFVNSIIALYKCEKIETFFEKLDPQYTYFFLLRPNVESRIVCTVDPSKPTVYLVGTILKGTTDGALVMEGTMLPDVHRMESVTITTEEELKEYIKGTDYWTHQGLILFHREKNKQIKFLHPQYKQMWSVRNNNPNLFLRYFEIRLDPKMLENFFKLYPKFISIADKFENQIFEMSKYLHQAYVDRYIRKQYVSLPKQEYVVLKKAHDWHNLDRNYNRMYRHKMLSLVNEEKPIHLYQIVKRHFKY